MPRNELQLCARLTHRQGLLRFDVDFTLAAPWTILFGMSGSGKTSLLRMIQGFSSPDKGRITLGHRALVDTERGICLPAHRRPVRTASQAARLFPRMTVRQNITWGAGLLSKPLDIDRHINQALHVFRLQALAEQLPEALSGGERQRVNVARAVVSAATSPGVLLLLDEPFNGLDHALRDDLAVSLRFWLERLSIPVLSVTHDVGEAFLLDAEILRLDGGKIVHQGPASVVLAEERERVLRQLGG